ncbi:efflux RND transporter periplasmic adaptor subunit [Undibacterium sp. SXout7W]|uniref:efflux RND transporter periplasmic adaptor subunit n=1 Tax=Undibacterium sp. SXout7W TaxID=3413049 RepID=UPI003BF15DA1
MNVVTATEKPIADETKNKPVLGSVSYPVNAPQLASIKVAALSEVSLPVADAMNGKLTYDENVTARINSPVLGRVVSSFAEIGDHVEKNKSLVLLDSPDLATADADLAKAKADESRKKLAYERSKNLLEHEVIASKDMESAAADYLQAAAETKRASLRMRNLNASGNENGKFALKAPIAGVIADKQINPGMELRPDAPGALFVISDLTRLWCIVDVSERYIGSIKTGQKIALTFDAYPEQVFDAVVDKVGLVLDASTRRIQVRAQLSNTEMKLRPEMFAKVSFLSENDKKVMEIPNAALIVEGLYHYVFIEKSEGVFLKKKINILRKGRDVSYAETDADSGLNKGQRIVTDGALLLNSEVASNAQ